MEEIRGKSLIFDEGYIFLGFLENLLLFFVLMFFILLIVIKYIMLYCGNFFY